jgi:putative membrane protein insertion efficiency factor
MVDPNEESASCERTLSPLAWLLIKGVRCYQLTLSSVMGGQCRFHPTCSEYFILAVRKYGGARGAWKGLGRILRCHPFHPGGVDMP